MKPNQYVDRVAAMEVALQEKCHEIKKSRAIVGQLLTQAVAKSDSLKNNSTNTEEVQTRCAQTQIFVESSNFGQQADTAPTVVEKEVEKIVI